MQEEKELPSRLSLALRALAGGDSAKASEIGASLLRRWPEEPSVHQFLAALALRQSKPEEAERWALSSLARRPDHYTTLVLAGAAARAKGDAPHALEFYSRADQLEATRPEAAFGAAAAAVAIDPGSASQRVALLLKRFPAPSPAWVEIGDACEREAQHAPAAEAYAMAMRAQPSVKLALRLGAALQSLGRRGEAATAFQSALQLNPESAEAWFKLGLTLQDSRLPERAEAAYRRALELRPDLAEAQANLGVALQEQGKLDAAKQAYGRAIALRPSAFGRVAQALTTAPRGELWLDLRALHAHLSELARLPL